MLAPRALSARQMQVNGPGPQLAAPRPGEPRLAAPGQQRPQEDDRGAQLAHQRVRYLRPVEPGGVDGHAVPVPMYLAAQAAQYAHRGVHVSQQGDVQELRLTGSEDGGRHYGQSRVFWPPNPWRCPRAFSRLSHANAHFLSPIQQIHAILCGEDGKCYLPLLSASSSTSEAMRSVASVTASSLMLSLMAEEPLRPQQQL